MIVAPLNATDLLAQTAAAGVPADRRSLGFVVSLQTGANTIAITIVSRIGTEKVLLFLVCNNIISSFVAIQTYNLAAVLQPSTTVAVAGMTIALNIPLPPSSELPAFRLKFIQALVLSLSRPTAPSLQNRPWAPLLVRVRSILECAENECDTVVLFVFDAAFSNLHH